MGILRDTYIVNKVDTSCIANQMRRQNDIQEKQNIILNETKDRVDISLNEYEKMKATIEYQKDLIKSYENFIKDLATHINVEPKFLLKFKLKDKYMKKNYVDLTYELFLKFEIDEIEALSYFRNGKVGG